MKSQTRVSLAIILCGAIISVSYTAYARVDLAYVSEKVKSDIDSIFNKVFDFRKSSSEVNIACTPLLKTGDPRDKVDVVIIGDGYSQSQMDLFKQDANAFKDNILAFEPFKSNAGKFNFYRLDVPQNLGCGCTTNGRGGCCDNNKIKEAATSCLPEFDQAIVSVNVDFNLGAAFKNIDDSTDKKGYAWAWHKAPQYNTVVHEFGHSFGGLTDEYFTPREVNISIDKNNDLGYDLNCSNLSCSKWCSATYSISELSNVNCSSKNNDQCVIASDAGQPCRLISSSNWNLTDNKCVNTVSLCAGISQKNKCTWENTYGVCSWRETPDPILGVNCVPSMDGLLSNVNIGKSCKENYGCYRGCKFGNWARSDFSGGIMGGEGASEGQVSTFNTASYQILVDALKMYSDSNSTVTTNPVATTSAPTTQTNTSTITQLRSQLQDLQNQLTQLQNQQTITTTTNNTSSTTLSTTTTSIPTLVFNSSFSNTSYGVEYYILSWGSVDAASCSSNWKPSALPTSGYENMAISGGAPATFTLTCTGAGGSTSKTISVGGTSATPATPVTSTTVTAQPVTAQVAPIVSTSTSATSTTPITAPTVYTATGTPSMVVSTATVVSPGFIITFPTAGWNLEMGEGYTIGWRYANNTGNLSTARLSLYQNGSYKDSIAIDIPNNGSYVWKVPTSLSAGSDYSIRLFNISASSSYADSPLFSIVPKGGIITTTTSAVSTTTIPIISSVSSTVTTSSPTTVANTPTPVPSPVVATPSTSTPVTTTPATTTTTSPGFFVTAPSSGVSINGGSVYTIRWQYASNAGNLSTARLSLYQNGSYKDFIAIDVPNNGSYAWTAPNLPGSGYSIRLFNLSYSNDYADSGGFSITAPSASSGQNNALASVLESVQSLLNNLAVSVKSLIK